MNATYPANGTTGNYGNGSGSGSITVGAANSSTVLAVTPPPSPSPAQPGSTLSFKATIGASPANANDPQPSGAVVWTITAPSGTAPTCSQGGDTQHMTSTTTGTNSTTCSFTLPINAPTGSYSASASYQGDGNYNPSASSSPATIGVSSQTLGTSGMIASAAPPSATQAPPKRPRATRLDTPRLSRRCEYQPAAITRTALTSRRERA